MENLAKKIEHKQPCLEYGVVAMEDQTGYTVLTDMGNCSAGPAFGCIVKPEKGDIVLLSVDATGRVYILSVLERPAGGSQPRTLLFDGQVNMLVRKGGFHVSADEELSLASRSKMALAAHRLEIDANEGTARIEELSFFGKMLHSRIEKIKIIADTVDSIFRRAVERLTSSYRYVEEHDEVQSASTRILVDGTLTMQTKNTMHTAEGHIKIDAEQIHLG